MPDLYPCPWTITEVVSNHGPRLQRLALQILHDRHWAEDVVQEALFRLSQESEPVMFPGAWLRTVVRRLALDRLRTERARQVNEQTAFMLLASQGAELGPAERVQFQELCRHVHDALAQLHEDDRTVVWLRCCEGLGREQLAEIWGISANAVTKRETRAKRRLGQLLAKTGIVPCVGASPSLLEAAVRQEMGCLHQGGAGGPNSAAVSTRHHPAGTQEKGEDGNAGPVREHLHDRSVGRLNSGDQSFADHRPWHRGLLAAVGLLVLLGVVTYSAYRPHRLHTGQQVAGRAIAKVPAMPQPGLSAPALSVAPHTGRPGWPSTCGWHLWEGRTITMTPRAAMMAPEADTGPVWALSCLCWSRTCVPLANVAEKAIGREDDHITLDGRDRAPTQALLAIWGDPLQYPARYCYTLVGDPAGSAQARGPVEIGFGCVLSPTPIAHAVCFRDASVQDACTERLRTSSAPVLVELVLQETSPGHCAAELLLDGRPASRWNPMPTTADQRLFITVAGLAITVSEPTLCP